MVQSVPLRNVVIICAPFVACKITTILRELLTRGLVLERSPSNLLSSLETMTIFVKSVRKLNVCVTSLQVLEVTAKGAEDDAAAMVVGAETTDMVGVAAMTDMVAAVVTTDMVGVATTTDTVTTDMEAVAATTDMAAVAAMIDTTDMVAVAAMTDMAVRAVVDTAKVVSPAAVENLAVVPGAGAARTMTPEIMNLAGAGHTAAVAVVGILMNRVTVPNPLRQRSWLIPLKEVVEARSRSR